MANFTSFMKPIIDNFIKYRKASQVWCNSYEERLKMFENHFENRNMTTGDDIKPAIRNSKTDMI